MFYEGEKDYIMRVIKESVRLLVTMLYGKEEDFLETHDYSLEEIQEGFTSLLEDAGYGEIVEMMK